MQTLPALADPRAVRVSESNPAPTLISNPLHGQLIAAGSRAVAASLQPTDLPNLREYVRTATALCAAGPLESIGEELTVLMSHYPRQELPDAVRDARWDQLLEDFEDMPLDVLAYACRAWRRSKERWAPTSGQLLTKCETILSFRRLLRDRARMVLEIMEAA